MPAARKGKEKPRVQVYTPPTRTFTTVANAAGSGLRKVFTAAPKVFEWIKPAWVSSIVYSGELNDTGGQAAAHSTQCPSGVKLKVKAKRYENSVRGNGGIQRNMGSNLSRTNHWLLLLSTGIHISTNL
jgi:hypothetical protein